ncbi:recombination factor protein [Streptococcus pyogenes]|nr:recombination factor protein [Streptococcus pyogenes]
MPPLTSKKRLQEIAEEAKFSGGLVLLLDEIHRLDKTKQDFLLPLLENGTIIMIGATTENPFFSVTPLSEAGSRFLNWNHFLTRILKQPFS